MKKMKLEWIALMMILLSGCNTPTKQESSEKPKKSERNFPEALKAAFEAHGGIEKWESFETLEFDVP